MMRTGFALALALILSPAIGLADTHGATKFRVTGLNPTEVLNMRVGPGYRYAIADTLPHDARNLASEVCVPTFTEAQLKTLNPLKRNGIENAPRWCLMRHEDGSRGWVIMRFVTEDGLN